MTQDMGIRGLSKGLATSRDLTHLWLQKCDITDAGLGVLGGVVGKVCVCVCAHVYMHVCVGVRERDACVSVHANMFVCMHT